MLAILNKEPILSKEGKPVHGRFYVFQKDTNRKADIYTYDRNNSLVKAQNPVYTDDFGFPEFEVILDDQIYSIVVEEYLGNYDDPKSDERPTSWNLCNSFYLGSVASENSGDVIYSASSLEDADISAGTVDVVGYWNSFDCEQRTFIWDPTSVDTVDNGYVFRSNKSSTGRWILVNNLPWIPSEYYGVYPGHLENLNKLTSCPETLGKTYSISVPNSIKFATGTYDLKGTLSTNTNGRTRSIIVDNKTCFGDKYNVVCQGITVLGDVDKDDDKYIGKLELQQHSEARFSWFPSLFDFARCGADTLIVDSYGINNELKENLTISIKTIKFEGGKIQWTSSNNSKLLIDGCNIIGTVQNYTNAGRTAYWNGFSSNTSFSNMKFTDKYILGYTHCNNLRNVTIDIDDFQNPVNFEYTCKLLNIKDIDLKGRTVEGILFFDDGGFRNYNYKNGIIESFQNASGSNTFSFENIQIKGFQNTGTKANLTFKNCKIGSFYTTQSVYRLSFENCNVGGNFTADYLDARKSEFGGNISSIETYYYNCILNGIIWVKANKDNKKISCVMSGNTFTTNSYIKLAAIDDYDRNNVLDCIWTNNTFASENYNGLYVQYKAGDYRYLASIPTEHKWIWEGNTGTCLQTYYETEKTLSSSSSYKTVDDLRFICFGEPSEKRLANSFDLVIKKIPGESFAKPDTVQNQDEFILTNDNWNDSYFDVRKYSDTDYFLHRFTLAQYNFSGKYLISVRQIGRA